MRMTMVKMERDIAAVTSTRPADDMQTGGKDVTRMTVRSPTMAGECNMKSVLILHFCPPRPHLILLWHLFPFFP